MVIFEWLVCVCIQYYSVYFLIRSSSLPIFLELIIANVQVFIPFGMSVYVCLYLCCMFVVVSFFLGLLEVFQAVWLT